jgi:hypothetical protein
MRDELGAMRRELAALAGGGGRARPAKKAASKPSKKAVAARSRGGRGAS